MQFSKHWDILYERQEFINLTKICEDAVKNQSKKWPEEFKNCRTFKPEDVIYEYNNYGFRCDDFHEGAEFDILALGCSFTEGIGLPYEYIWQNQLGKLLNVGPIANLGTAGCGLETISRSLYVALNQIKIKPKTVIALLPNILRAEGFVNDLEFDRKMYYFFPNAAYFNDRGYKDAWEKYVESLNVRNRMHTLIKEVLFMNALCKTHGINFIWHSWGSLINLLDYKISDSLLISKYYNRSWRSLDLYKVLNVIAPQEVLETGLDPSKCTWVEKMINSRLPFLSEEEMLPFDVAADLLHPGPNIHLNFAKGLVGIIKERFNYD